jgi:prevent-host-death family protein
MLLFGVYIFKCKLKQTEDRAMKATAKDLRFHSKELLDTVNRGEEVVITFRGKPRAKLVPYTEERERVRNNDLFGIWKDNEMIQDVNEYVRGLRKGRN